MNITNDTPAESGWADGGNSHGETLATVDQYIGALLGAKLTIDFAVADETVVPDQWIDPYHRGGLPQLFAQNEDQLAWYSYSPGNPLGLPEGGYYIPTYDFGDILPGQSVARDLYFAFEEGISINSADPRYSVLFGSRDWHYDILYNRTSSLKNSDWVSGIDTDFGNPISLGSNSSVFHNVIPEPATILLLGFGLLGLLLTRKH